MCDVQIARIACMQCIIAMMCYCVCMLIFVRTILRYRTLLQFSSLRVCNGYRTFPERLFWGRFDRTSSDAAFRCQYCTSLLHTHPFNGPLPGTNRLSRYQKGKTNLDFSESKDSGGGITWAICMSASRTRETTTQVPQHSVFTDPMPFLPLHQQRQSTEGTAATPSCDIK